MSVADYIKRSFADFVSYMHLVAGQHYGIGKTEADINRFYLQYRSRGR